MKTSYLLSLRLLLLLAVTWLSSGTHAQSLGVDLVHIEVRTNSSLNYRTLVSNTSLLGDPGLQVLAPGEWNFAEGLLVELTDQTLCEEDGSATPNPLQSAHRSAQDLIVLWPTTMNCRPLIVQLSQLVSTFPRVKGVLMYGSENAPLGSSKNAMLLDFSLPVVYVSEHYAEQLKAFPEHFTSKMFRSKALSLPSSEASSNETLHSPPNASSTDKDLPWSNGYALHVTVSTDSPTLEAEIWRFSLGIMAILLCVSFVLSILTNYYFYESRRASQLEALQAQMLQQWEQNGRRSGPPFPQPRRQPVLSSDDLDRFPVFTYNSDKAKSNQKKRRHIFKERRLQESKKFTHPNDGPTVHTQMSMVSLKSIQSSLSMKSLFNKDNCPVCLEDFEEGEQIRELACLHWFHSECVDKWLTHVSATCPMCKEEFQSSNADAGPTQPPSSDLINGEGPRQLREMTSLENVDLSDVPLVSIRVDPPSRSSSSSHEPTHRP